MRFFFFPFDHWPEPRDSEIDEPVCPAGIGYSPKGNNPNNWLIGWYLQEKLELPKNHGPE